MPRRELGARLSVGAPRRTGPGRDRETPRRVRLVRRAPGPGGAVSAVAPRRSARGTRQTQGPTRGFDGGHAPAPSGRRARRGRTGPPPATHAGRRPRRVVV